MRNRVEHTSAYKAHIISTIVDFVPEMDGSGAYKAHIISTIVDNAGNSCVRFGL